MLTFQKEIKKWCDHCFGPIIAGDKEERNYRFLEESLELVQACGATKEDCVCLVDYVFNRPLGEARQEVGGVMVTLAALCNAHNINLHDVSFAELSRIWGKVDKIRKKHFNKPLINHKSIPGQET